MTPRTVRPLVLALAVGLLGAPAATRAAELLVGNKSADTVWRLSLRDGRRIGEFRTGEAPHEIAVAPDGRIAVVTNYGDAKSGSSLRSWTWWAARRHGPSTWASTVRRTVCASCPMAVAYW